MGLRRLQFEEDYRTGEQNILESLFRPALQESLKYWRAVGYFSSSALEAFGAPLAEFVRNGGTIRLITSVELRKEDIAAIESGLSRREVCEKRIEQIVDEEFSGPIGDGVAALGVLLRVGRLEIRIAVPKRGRGIYHEKVGVFFDASDYVSFSGSSNESRQAFEENYESIDVYPSWTVPSRAERKLRHFEKLWENKDKGADTYPFPAAAKEKLIRVSVQEPGAVYTIGGDDSPKSPSWRHQQEALETFLRLQRGVLNMATGTGKTRTALNIIERLVMEGNVDLVVVSTEGNDLLRQWYGHVLALATKAKGVRVYRHFQEYKDINEFVLGGGKRLLICSRLNLDMALRQLVSKHGRRMLLIEDEVHGVGSPANRERLKGLTDTIRFRLGLSATPEREYDEDGNEFIERYIGPVIFEFGLENAIARGILAPFNYFPLEYQITEDDRQRLANVYKRKAAREAAGTPMSKEEVWIELAKVYKTSSGKLPVFERFISTRRDLLQRCIVFVETQEYGDAVIERVHKIHPEFHTYYSGEESTTLKKFARGELQCLVTCHRLSEGIDIRSLTTVVLFSSARARLETIQRMGRCLRADPNESNKIANVIDFVRTTDGHDDTPDEDRRGWLEQLSKVRMREGVHGVGSDN